MTIKDLHPEKERKKVEQVSHERSHKITETKVWNHVKKNGQLIYVRIVSHPIKISGNNYKLAVATDITKQKKIEEKYYFEQDLLSIIMEKLPGTFFVFNKDGEMLRWNKQLEYITGFSKEEVQEKPIITYFEEEEQGKILEAIDEAYDTGSVEVESEIRRKDGIHVPILFNASSTIYHNEECIVGVGLDISKQVNLLKEKEILISEIHHRVKNNLALINSLLYLQTPEMEEGNVPKLIHNTQMRIKIIALVHELLYQSDCLINIDYAKYFKELVALVKQAYSL